MKRFWRIVGPLMEGDSGASGGGESTPVEAAASASAEPVTPAAAEPVKLINPLLREDSALFREDNTVIPAPVNPSVPEIRKLNFGGREVPVIDPVVEDLHKDYVELTRSYTQTNQTLKQLEMNNVQLQQMVQNFQMMQQQAPTVTPQAPAAPTPEEIEAQKEAFMESFYDNPEKAIQDMARKLINQEVSPVIDPIQKDQAFHAEARRLAATHADFGETIPTMQQLVGARPELESQGLEYVYGLAKTFIAMGLNPSAAAPAEPVPVTPVTPVTPAAPVDEKTALMNDPAFRTEIFNQMILERQQQQSVVPTVMGNQPGGNGNIPIIPENKPQSIRDATKAYLRHLGL